MAVQFNQSVVVITGAASGIGAALALNLAARGAALALTDRDANRLALVANQARKLGAKVSEHCFDMQDIPRIQALPDEVIKEHGRVNVVINNAGIAAIGQFSQVAPEVFDQVMAINFVAPVQMTRAFLPHLSTQNAAHLVYLSSIFGIISPPGQAAYCSSKFAIRGFSEVLRHELEGSAIRVSTVHPGGIKTNIAASAVLHKDLKSSDAAQLAKRFDEMAPTTAEQAAEVIITGMLAGQERILIGADARFLERISRLLPVKYWQVIKRKFMAE